MLSELQPTNNESNEVLFTMDKVDEIAEKRNRKVNRELAELQEKHDELKAQVDADNQLLAEKADLQSKLESLDLDLAEEEELQQLQQQVAEVSAQRDFFKAQYESDSRRVALHRAVAEHGAISIEQVQAMLPQDIAPDEVGPAVRKLRETAPNLFANPMSSGIGGKTEPGRATSELGFVSAAKLASMDQATYLRLRAQGAFKEQLGPRRKY